MPLRVCTGFEFGPIATAAGFTKGNDTAPSNRIVNAAVGSPSVVSALPAVRNGAYALELNPAGEAGGEYIQWTTNTLGTSQTFCVVAFAFQFPTALPTADVRISVVDIAIANNCTLFFRDSDNRLVVSANDNLATAVDGPVVAAGTWYYAELSIDVSGATHTIDWWIDGVAQPQATFASAADTIGQVRLGTDIAQTMTCRYDDVVIWTDTSAIPTPVGRHKVVKLLPDSAGTTAQIGTADATGRMVTNSAIDATHNSANIIAALRDFPPTLGATASGVGQRIVGVGNAVGIPMETYTLAGGETIAGVRILVAGWAATATTNTFGLRVFNGTTEEILFATADPNFDALDPCAWLCKQVAGATMFTTQAQLNAMVVRLGYSGDISPLPGAHAVCAEVAIKESVQTVAPAAVTVSAAAGTLTVAGTSPVQTVTPAAVTVTATAGSLAIRLNVQPAAVTVTVTPGTLAISGVGPVQNILPTGPTVTVTPGTVALSLRVSPAAVTASVTPGTATIGRARAVLTESFNKANGALGPDLAWRRQITPTSTTDQWAVVSNAAALTVTDADDVQAPIDYLATADQVVSFDITGINIGVPGGDYEFGAGIYTRLETLGAGTDHRGYLAALSRNNVWAEVFGLPPGTPGWTLAMARIDTTQTPPGDAVLLGLAVGGDSAIVLPATLVFYVIGDLLELAVFHAGSNNPIMLSTNDATFAAGRYTAIRGGAATAETGTLTGDNFRAAIAQHIEPEPVAVTATAGTIGSVTGGAEVTQNILLLAGDDTTIDSGDTPVPPVDIVDAGDTATPPADIYDANLNVVLVNVTPGTLTIAVVQTQAITPLPVVVTATPGTLQPLKRTIAPAAVTVTASAGALTVTGGAVIGPVVNLEVTVAPTRSRAQAEPDSSGTRSRAAATVTDQTRSRGQIDTADQTRVGVLVDATRG